ncbi:hypothetical protein [Hwanghaeella sp.]|uniref:hypothetical protein n=1 Tax=Hwanghaeella sp. TaxID=2605943 RepID=UPI003CCBEA54
MATQNQISALHAECKRVLSFEVEQMVSNPDWGAINFKDCEKDILETRKFIQLWLHSDVSIVPDKILNLVKGQIESFGNALDAIQHFSIEQNAEKKRQQIGVQIRAYKDQLSEPTAAWLPFLHSFEGLKDHYTEDLERRLADLETNLRARENQEKNLKKHEDARIHDLQETLKKANKVLVDAQARSENILSEAAAMSQKIIKQVNDDAAGARLETEQALNQARKIAAEKAIAPYTHSFSEAADNWGTGAKAWLFVASALLVGTGAWAYLGLVKSIPQLEGVGPLVQYFSSRLLITILLVSAVWWSARQYRVAMHQKTLNQHKADALRSFEAFIEATNSNDVRDAVILQTSQTIFGQASTGFLEGNREGSIDDYAKVANSIQNAAQVVSKSS